MNELPSWAHSLIIPALIAAGGSIVSYLFWRTKHRADAAKILGDLVATMALQVKSANDLLIDAETTLHKCQSAHNMLKATHKDLEIRNQRLIIHAKRAYDEFSHLHFYPTTTSNTADLVEADNVIMRRFSATKAALKTMIDEIGDITEKQ